MEKAKINVQEQVLNVSRKERILVELHLLNGQKIRGYIQSFDGYCILVKGEDDKEVMVYKHALASVIPQSPLPLTKKGTSLKEE